jgi:hypothetical protein
MIDVKGLSFFMSLENFYCKRKKNGITHIKWTSVDGAMIIAKVGTHDLGGNLCLCFYFFWMRNFASMWYPILIHYNFYVHDI